MESIEKIKVLEKQLQSLRIERREIEKKIENIKLEKEVNFNKEEELINEINNLKGDGINRFLGRFAVVDSFRYRKHYIYITSVATEYSGCFMALSGPNFYIDTDDFKYIGVGCTHESAHNNYVLTINSPEEVNIITKDEFFSAFDKFQKEVNKIMHTSIEATPIMVTKNEYVYNNLVLEKII